MLFKSNTLSEIAAGRIDLAFRRWTRPTVVAGGALRTAIGVLTIVEVTRVDLRRISDAEARRAGFGSRNELVAELERRDTGDVYRVRVRHSGADPRTALRERAALTAEERATVTAALERLDKASRAGVWTRRTLELVRDRPATLAGDLAAAAGWERDWFKRNVRKLKELGLTESLDVGYRLSPRGRAFLS